MARFAANGHRVNRRQRLINRIEMLMSGPVNGINIVAPASQLLLNTMSQQ